MRNNLYNKFTKSITKLLLAALVTTFVVIPVNYSYADMCGGLEMEDVYTPDPSDVIQDPILHWAVRSSLNSIKDKDIILTPELVGSKSVETIIYENGSHPEDFEQWGGRQYLVKSLDGLQYATSANHIDISYSDGVAGNEIEDLSPLSNLIQLSKLKLYKDGITDISALAGLKNMKELSVRSNQITDISAVAGMSKLTNLDFGYNQVSDVSAISGLTNLKYLDMCNNQITSLPDMTQLKSLESLNVSNNNLSEADVETLAVLTNLQSLDLSNNEAIHDVKPLVELVNLAEDKTFLPVKAETKADLFAAINVNSDFQVFNISRMESEDLDFVKIALDGYDSLTEEQKSYLDTDMVDASRSNYAKVSSGDDPDYYEDYDRSGVQRPVFNRVNITVVDNEGHPLEGVKVIRSNYGELEYTTDASGKVSMPHASWDSGEYTVTVDAEGYICRPESMSYEVKNHKTYVINGKRATGLEKLQFVLTRESDYVEKTELKNALDTYIAADEEYLYTEKSYSSYEDARSAAQNAYDVSDATQDDVNMAITDLRAAYESLEYIDVLTTLKINIRDKNGNIFVRPFKLQVFPVGGKMSQAWNIWADADNEISNGIARQEARPTWKVGAEYDIMACTHEAYDFDQKIRVTIGKTEDGTVYFSKVNGKPVSASYVANVKAIPKAHADDQENEIKPDGSRLSSYIDMANGYVEADYTPASYENLTITVESAENIMSQSVAQEVYNKAGADIVAAIDGLIPKADTLALEKAIDLYYYGDVYTRSSWNNYQEILAAAQLVYENDNATQTEVDAACAELKSAQSKLELLGNKENLEKKLAEAQEIDQSKCEIGYSDLLDAIANGKEVLADPDAGVNAVTTAENAIDDAISNIVYYPEESEWDCMPSRFRAKVIDADGCPVSDVPFKVVSGGNVIEVPDAVSDANGIIDFYVDVCEGDVENVVTIDGDEYGCNDKHTFVITKSKWFTSISTLDGESFTNGTNLTYTVETNTKSLKSPSVVVILGAEKYEATGDEIIPDMSIADGYKTLEEGKDYNLVIKDNIKIGTAEVIITGIGDYRDSVVRHFRVISPTIKPSFESRRIYGQNRIDTSIKAADEFKSLKKIDKFENIVIASGQSFPDALSGSYLAKVKNAPVLLVNEASEDIVGNYVKENIAEDGQVYILGGKNAVSYRFETSLTPVNVVRLGGANRYATNILILQEAGVTNEALIVCVGNNYADSLSASAVGLPIFIVGKTLTSAQVEYLSELSSTRAYAIGGTGVVSESVMEQIVSSIPTKPEYTRIAGANRYETSALVAETFFRGNIRTAVLAYGKNFPDGLSGGPVALALDAPLILVTNENSGLANTFCKDHNVKQVYVLGGTGLIGDEVFNSMIVN